MASEAAILAAMATCRRQIEAAEEALREARKRLGDLEDFSARLNRRNEAVTTDLGQRRQRLMVATTDSWTSNCFGRYKTQMQTLLDEGRVHTDQFEVQRTSVCRAINQAEEDISHQRRVINQEEDELTQLNQRLRAVRAANLAGV